MSSEYLRAHGTEPLADGLRREERIVYSSNGNRSVRGATMLRRLEPILPRIGVTRIGDISFLSPANYPVFQSCRPNVFGHACLGQNSGSQGKGPTRTQALVSCMMESVEQFCAEPRNPDLVRARYSYLEAHRFVADPASFLRVLVNGKPARAAGHDELLMWTPAYALFEREPVLVPAETVYFPFLPKQYATRSLFPSGSNGLASGATYLEAVIHGLYEVIERHYYARLYDGTIGVEAFFEEELEHLRVDDYMANGMEDFELQMYGLEIPGLENLPVVMGILTGVQGTYLGFGCSSSVEISMQRAMSEVMQSYATEVSSAREDLGWEEPPRRRKRRRRQTIFSITAQPEARTLTIDAFKRRVHDERFVTLSDELEFVLRIVKTLGASEIYAANLTRAGIEIPVVKIVACGLDAPDDLRVPSSGTPARLDDATYPNRNAGLRE